MTSLAVCSILFVGALAVPQGYDFPVPSDPLIPGGGIAGGFGGRISSSFKGDVIGGVGGSAGFGEGAFGGSIGLGGGFHGGISTNLHDYGLSCGNGKVIHVDGSCVVPMVSRNVFVYAAPQQNANIGPTPRIPNPKVEYNLVFVRTPEVTKGAEPIVVPPPQQKTLVYVLSKKQTSNGQQLIEVPAGPFQQPEVFYVNYNEGENPQLPGGVRLQEALRAAARPTKNIGGAVGGGIARDIGLGGSFSGDIGGDIEHGGSFRGDIGGDIEHGGNFRGDIGGGIGSHTGLYGSYEHL